MAKPRSAPTSQAFKAPEVPDLTLSYDPFAAAKQFDAMRSSFGAAAPFQMPTPQPKPMPMQAMPYEAAPAPGWNKPAMPAPKGTSLNARPAPGQPRPTPSKSSWGTQTQTFQQQFPSLRHTSGYRSPEHNARTPGASKTSYHMQRDAEGNSRANDYVGSARDMSAAGAWARANGAKEVLIHNAGTGQHLHIAWS